MNLHKMKEFIMSIENAISFAQFKELHPPIIPKAHFKIGRKYISSRTNISSKRTSELFINSFLLTFTSKLIQNTHLYSI